MYHSKPKKELITTSDIDREIFRLLKDVFCKILYGTKTSVDIEEELINVLHGNGMRRLRPINGRVLYRD